MYLWQDGSILRAVQLVRLVHRCHDINDAVLAADEVRGCVDADDYVLRDASLGELQRTLSAHLAKATTAHTLLSSLVLCRQLC